MTRLVRLLFALAVAVVASTGLAGPAAAGTEGTRTVLWSDAGGNTGGCFSNCTPTSGAPVVLHARVGKAFDEFARPFPTGVVTFLANGQPHASAELVDGYTRVVLNDPPGGAPVQFTARYEGDARYAASTSGTLSYYVNRSADVPSTGYWMLSRAGAIYPFGKAGRHGAPNTPTASDIEPTPSGKGYWVVDDAGRVYAYGDARQLGGSPPLSPGEVVTSLSRTNTGSGYWLFTTRGRAIGYGDAPFLGDMSAVALNGPVLDSVPTPSGAGYYMVASDGGIFTFGDASFRGSMGSTRLNAPVQSLVPHGGGGYWLVASDGGIFAFDAPFYGSMGSTKLNKPVTGMVGGTDGYLMVAEDGGIFTFGDIPFHGSLGSNPPPSPVIAAAVVP